jgi:glycosyltransferase involved in cell wall biosynthesis
MKVLFLTRYDQQGASSRMRCLQFLPLFKCSNIEAVVSPLLSDRILKKRYLDGVYHWSDLFFVYWRRIEVLLGKYQFDIVWIEKEALPWLPVWIELLLLRGKPFIVDLDDAVFHNYDQHRFMWVRWIYGRRIDALMARANLVVVGNQYLADRATNIAGVKWVEILSTVIDLRRYEAKQTYIFYQKPRIVWIGSPSTVKYLMALSPMLASLGQRQSFILRVIGGGIITMPGVEIESAAWTIETEVSSLLDCDVGIMPLTDGFWERGKCAYKLIQYMACGLPTVASFVGKNIEVVVEGETGFLVETSVSWLEKLELLLNDTMLRERLGKAGRTRVVNKFSIQHLGPSFVKLIQKVGAN